MTVACELLPLDTLSPHLRGASPNDFSDISSSDGNVYTPTDSAIIVNERGHTPQRGTSSIGSDWLLLDNFLDMERLSATESDTHENSPAAVPENTSAESSVPDISWQNPSLATEQVWTDQSSRVVASGESNVYRQEGMGPYGARSSASFSQPHHMMPTAGPFRAQSSFTQGLQLQTSPSLVTPDTLRNITAPSGPFVNQPVFNEPWNTERLRYNHPAGSDSIIFGPASSEDLEQYFVSPNQFTSSASFAYIPSPSSAGSPMSARQMRTSGQMSRQQSLTSESPQDFQQPPALLNPQNPSNPYMLSPEDWLPSLPTEDSVSTATQSIQRAASSSASASTTGRSPQPPQQRPQPQAQQPPQQQKPSSLNLPTRKKSAPPRRSGPRPSSEAETSFPIIQYAESSRTAGRERTGSTKGISKRSGGRVLGSHLTSDKAAKTKKMRADVACWLCSLQRDECTSGDVCDRCFKRSHRPNSDHVLECVRTKLPDLREQFLPNILTSIHETQNLQRFVQQHIGQWYNVGIKLTLECGKHLPWIECEVYQFQPRTEESLRTFVGTMDTQRGKQAFIARRSPPLGMQQVEKQDRHQYDQYVTTIVDHYFHVLTDHYYLEETDQGYDFPVQLLRIMHRMRPRDPDEEKLMRDVFRLIVVTYIMGRALKIPDEFRDRELSRMFNYSPGLYGKKTCPRMANKQLKYLFASLHTEIMGDVLKKLQQYLRSSRGTGKWTSAFCAILGLAIVHEDTQRTIHLVMQSEAAQDKIPKHQSITVAENACRAIDDRFVFITNLFRTKYSRTFNPLNPKEEERPKIIESLGEDAVNFIDDVRGLCVDRYNYLFERQHVNIAAENQEKYPARLISRFLLPFWSPS